MLPSPEGTPANVPALRSVAEVKAWLASGPSDADLVAAYRRYSHESRMAAGVRSRYVKATRISDRLFLACRKRNLPTVG